MNTLKTYNVKNLFIALSLLFSLTTMKAQQGWELGGWVGGSHYFGDLNTNFNLSRPGLALGAIGRYNFNNRLSIKMNINYSIFLDDSPISLYESEFDIFDNMFATKKFKSSICGSKLIISIFSYSFCFVSSLKL